MENTRQLLKIFGVAVTDFEAEAEQLKVVAAQLFSDTGKDEIANQLKSITQLCQAINTRWLEITGCVFAAQNELLAQCSEAAACLQFRDETTD